MFRYKNIYLTIGGTPFSTPFGCGRAQRGRAGVSMYAFAFLGLIAGLVFYLALPGIIA
jgi:hypothetical protein